MSLKVQLDDVIKDYSGVKKAIQHALNPKIEKRIRGVIYYLPTNKAIEIYKVYRKDIEIQLIEAHEEEILKKVLKLVDKELREAGINDN